ncbi:MAG: MBL fold metallo-hydrolase [Solirubrobacterales bacterium]|nr:MBL fold metallo-hydrolase [Solirubrobacterales bacterium]MCB8914673.1 MBL fold metallo-hydrolase [Thermoleophilales bacterium]
MKLTVLGKSPAWQDAGGACSGYLVTEGDTTLLLDCGNGVFGKLRQYIDYVDVDAIVISHHHVDHIIDLIPYGFALKFAPRQQPVPVDRWPGTDSPARPQLFVPPGAIEFFNRVSDAWGTGNLFDDAFETTEYDPEDKLEIGPFSIGFTEVPHYITTYAMDLTGPTGSRITYGADCCPNPALVELAQGTDLLIAESTLPRPERIGMRGHLTPSEAGEHAKLAGARELILTHISDELDPDWAVAEASSVFEGPVRVAREGLEVEV